jgi:hypothetical protein
VASRAASPVQLLSGGSISGPSGNQDASLPFVLCSLLQREFSGRRSPYRRGRKPEHDEDEPVGGQFFQNKKNIKNPSAPTRKNSPDATLLFFCSRHQKVLTDLSKNPHNS